MYAFNLKSDLHGYKNIFLHCSMFLVLSMFNTYYICLVLAKQLTLISCTFACWTSFSFNNPLSKTEVWLKLKLLK